MISYIRGTLAFFEEDKVIVDVGGVGYGIYMSGQDMSRLGDMHMQLLFGSKEMSRMMRCRLRWRSAMEAQRR